MMNNNANLEIMTFPVNVDWSQVDTDNNFITFTQECILVPKQRPNVVR